MGWVTMILNHLAGAKPLIRQKSLLHGAYILLTGRWGR